MRELRTGEQHRESPVSVCIVKLWSLGNTTTSRAKKQGSRFSRTPFIISCAFLYFCMVTPVMITSQICRDLPLAFSPITGGIVPLLEQSCRFCIVLSLFGFLLGAVGDLNKTIGKALKGEDELITGFVFRFFRHPNYTGEVICDLYISPSYPSHRAFLGDWLECKYARGIPCGCIKMCK